MEEKIRNQSETNTQLKLMSPFRDKSLLIAYTTAVCSVILAVGIMSGILQGKNEMISVIVGIFAIGISVLMYFASSKQNDRANRKQEDLLQDIRIRISTGLDDLAARQEELHKYFNNSGEESQIRIMELREAIGKENTDTKQAVRTKVELLEQLVVQRMDLEVRIRMLPVSMPSHIPAFAQEQQMLHMRKQDLQKEIGNLKMEIAGI